MYNELGVTSERLKFLFGSFKEQAFPFTAMIVQRGEREKFVIREASEARHLQIVNVKAEKEEYLSYQHLVELLLLNLESRVIMAM